WTSGDHGEVFLTDQSDKTTYYQFAFDCLGNKCDLNNHQRMEWNGKWDCVVRKTKDGWDAILSIPLKTINLNLGKGKKIKALFYRQYDHNDRKLHENSSWGGGGVHQTAEFGEITLMR
ncbi:MAG: hypothetical protein KAG97_09290, partial [Victivallales bacterium]|nr:hypothetical protein [Victivallales bacterium]